MKWLKFRAAYVDGNWVSPFFVQLDAEGKIHSTQTSLDQRADEDHDFYLLPGIPNGHSHSFQYVMSGLSERVVPGREKDDFWFWREQMYRLANAIDLEDLLHVTTQLYSNMLEYGYTSVTEFHYLNHDFEGRAYDKPTRVGEVIMESAKRAGIHLTLVPVYYHQAAPNTPIKPQQKRFYFESVDRYLRFIEETVRSSRSSYPDVTVGYGVHSLRAAPLVDIKTILSQAWTTGPCHFHASEQTADVESFVAAYKQRPIEWLAENVPLGVQHNLVHATHIDAQEREILVKSGATVVLCPTTESNLGDGIFPILEYQLSGGSWSIGSDSQVNLNPFLEMAAPELTQRLLDRKRNVFCRTGEYVSGDILFNAALRGGRRSLGLPQESFSKGSYFEGLLVDPEHDRLLARPLGDLLSILCFAPEKDMIHSVYSKGLKRVEAGHHIAKRSNVEGYRKALGKLMSSLQTL